MTRTAAQRERARLKKERQRERKRASAVAAAVVEAEYRDRIDEELSPSVMRDAVFVRGKEGPMLIGPRVQIIEGRAVRTMVDPINALRLSLKQRRAAQMLQADWRDVGCGVGVGALDYLRAGGGSGDGLGGHKAMLEQIATRTRLEAAMTFLGAFAPSVARVVLDGVPVSVWASETSKTSDAARGWIVAALDRLGLFYWPPKDGHRERPLLTFGPSRESYDMGSDDDG